MNTTFLPLFYQRLEIPEIDQILFYYPFFYGLGKLGIQRIIDVSREYLLETHSRIVILALTRFRNVKLRQVLALFANLWIIICQLRR